MLSLMEASTITPNSDGVPEDFYIYQECGTPVSEHEVDNTKRQWAYVKWRLEG